MKYEIGRVYNCVKVLRLHYEPSGNRQRLMADVECIYCGKHKTMNASDLMHERTNSCTCQIVKHGMNQSRIYAIYHNMKYRCMTETAPAYPHYGGRGITVSPAWLDPVYGFENFYMWAMANGYEDDLTIDRIDIDGNYTPENCRWITKSLNTGLSNKDHPRRHQ